MPSTKSPPVIDFSDYLSGDQKRMEYCAAQIREACLTQGFFQIVNHNIPLNLQKEMFKVSKEFFDLPLEEKMKLDKSLVSEHFPSDYSISALQAMYCFQCDFHTCVPS